MDPELRQSERQWGVLDAVRAVARELGATPSQVALAWLLRKPQVTSIIFGARTPAQLEDNLAAAALALPDSAMASLEQASAIEHGYPYEMISRVHGRS